MEYIITVCLVFCEMSALACLCTTWLKWRWSKYNFWYFTFLGIIVMFAFSEFLGRHIQSGIKSLITIALLLAFILVFWSGNIFLKLLLVICYHVISYGMDYVAGGIVCMSQKINFATLIQRPVTFTICSILSKSLLLLLTYLFYIFFKKNRQQHKSLLQWLQMLLYPIISLSVLIIGLNSMYPQKEPPPAFIILTIGLMIATTVQLLLLEKIDADTQAVLERELLQQKLQLQSQNMQLVISAYQDQRKIDHDHTNQLLALHGALTESPETALQFLESLLGKQSNRAPVFQTGNAVVDALLNVKCAQARKLLIETTVKICSLQLLNLSENEIAIVLGNLLDNAINAASKCSCEKKLLIQFNPLPQKILLRIENSYMSPEKSLSNGIDSLRHGYGLKNVQQVLQNHGCLYRIKTTENVYSVTIELPIKVTDNT